MQLLSKILTKTYDLWRSFKKKQPQQYSQNDEFYISRTLRGEQKTYTEEELLDSSKYIVVLAEPGGGKTELLGSLATQLETKRISASFFRHNDINAKNNALVIDAFDEVSRIDSSSIVEILAKINTAGADKVIISSRSSEWDTAFTHHFKEFLGESPKIVSLIDFNQEEQKRLFEHYTKNEDFTHFLSEISRFDLEVILHNPQFLQMFADAYIESEGHFEDKKSIFEKSIYRLAKEANPRFFQKKSIKTEKKIELASEVFSKLLLSGSEGVTLSELKSTRLYPQLASLFNDDTSVDSILDTRLFKLGDNQSLHVPIHKIVAEYCAAKYLTNRINDSTDNLSLCQCLAVIAPNSIVRDELRGLLGWMAALGNEPIQKATISLDPYAILANGDPSQLLPLSKRLLIQKLTETANEDPYFRRGDMWRSFSAADFMTSDVVGELKPLLTGTNGNGHLRGLLLELLVGSQAIPYLVNELQQLMLSPDSDSHTRFLSCECLLEVQDYDHKNDISVLISEGSETSLSIAAKAIKEIGTENFKKLFLLNYLIVCTNLYPDHQKRFTERTIGARYFVRQFISTIKLPTIEWLLDELTYKLSCCCGKESYECDCRNGVSKVVGTLLDRYFDLSSTPYNPEQIWAWVKELNFHGGKSAEQSASVQELSKNTDLRQGIIKLAFRDETNPDKILDISTKFFNSYSHSGLSLQSTDYRFIVDLAFSINNIALWSHFMAVHLYYQAENCPNELRCHMRMQANQKPEFMREWARKNRSIKKQYKQNNYRFRSSKYLRKQEIKQTENRRKNIKYIKENREIVESGTRWGFLEVFAESLLFHPDQIETQFGCDITLVKTALRNCVNFIEPEVPSLKELATLHCDSKYRKIRKILYAACLEAMKHQGNLENVKPFILAALYINLDMNYPAVSDKDHTALKTEVERLLFNSTQKVENFINEYIEQQLSIEGCKHPQVSWLRYQEKFKPFQKTLPIEWLQRFQNLSLYTQEELVEMVAQYGNHKELEGVIEIRCAEIMSNYPEKTDREDIENLRNFWLINAFYFLPEINETYWNWLKKDKDIIFAFNERSGPFNHSDNSNRPSLSAQKIEAILDAYIDVWSVVELPNTYGTDSPAEEKAYRFLSDVMWKIGKDDPDNSLPVLDRLITDTRFKKFKLDLLSIRASVIREKAFQDFNPPSPSEIVALLDRSEVVTVEGLRAILLEEFQDYQADLDGSDTTSKDIFYENNKHLGEVPATQRIADRMRLRLQDKCITVTLEHQLKDAKRCDFTCSKTISRNRKLLVVEVKGQWHSELYTAVSKQLNDRYANHPDAEHQGIYLVLWFGVDEKVAGKKNTKLKTADDLKLDIENKMPVELRGVIDVFVLDLSLAK